MLVIVGDSIVSRCVDRILFDGCRHSDHIQSYQCGKSSSDQSSEIEQLFLLISIVTGSLRQCRDITSNCLVASILPPGKVDRFDASEKVVSIQYSTWTGMGHNLPYLYKFGGHRYRYFP